MGYEGRGSRVVELAQRELPLESVLMSAFRSEEQAHYPKGKETVSVANAI
jgi:hypothetical protein